MSYKYTRGSQVIGDLKAEDDTQRNTIIDFGEDRIDLQTSGSTRLKISGSQGQITFNEAFTFPTTDGSSDQVLATDGNGVLSWVDQSAGGSGGGGLEYAVGHVDLTTNNKPVNWVNASSISAASGIKSWFIVPKATKIDKVIVSVKGNNFSTANDGNVTLSIYKNQQDYGSTIVNQTVGADTFTEKVSNFSGGTTDCNQKVFSNLNQSVAEGDVIHIKVGKSAGSDKEAIVTLVFDSGAAASTEPLVLMAHISSDFNVTTSDTNEYLTVPFDSVLKSTFADSDYNTSTHTFTAPEEGYYFINCSLYHTSINDTPTQYQVRISSSAGWAYGGAIAFRNYFPETSVTSVNTHRLDRVAHLSGSDQVKVTIRPIASAGSYGRITGLPHVSYLTIQKL